VELPELQDLRRDAEDILRTEVSVHIQDLRLEDIPDPDEIHMIKDVVEDNQWTGWYTVETNAEKIYEVSYHYEKEVFYVTTYLMTVCKKYDPPHKY